MFKKILIALAIIFVVIQFIRPAKNLSGHTHYNVATKYEVPAAVSSLMKVACNDCHTNTTRYPWYSNVQPAAWWLANHVREGKEKLNFDEFTNRRIAWQNHKFEEVVEMVEEKEMPLKSYTWLGLHPEADLSDQQRSLIINWAKAQMDTLAAHYPADSLVMKRG